MRVHLRDKRERDNKINTRGDDGNDKNHGEDSEGMASGLAARTEGWVTLAQKQTKSKTK